MRVVSVLSYVFVIIGALNWLLVGVARFDLVRALLGRTSPLGRVVYTLVGVAGITQLTNAVRRAVRHRPTPLTGAA
jgi:uncharacterized membrane protein YuzA (DUF378 family)